MPTIKKETPAQRTSNPVWLREQIQGLIEDCDDNIKEDSELAEQARDDDRTKYLARVESAEHWKRSLERILRGKTFVEDLAEGLRRGARRRG